jgi:hypothetical protein
VTSFVESKTLDIIKKLKPVLLQNILQKALEKNRGSSMPPDRDELIKRVLILEKQTETEKREREREREREENSMYNVQCAPISGYLLICICIEFI